MSKKFKQSSKSIDGISPRTGRNRIGDFRNPRPMSSGPIDIDSMKNQNKKAPNLITDTETESMTFEDVQTDEPVIKQADKKLSRKERQKAKKSRRKEKKQEKKESRKHRFFLFRRPVRNIVVLILFLVLSLGGFLGVKLYFAHRDIFNRNGGGAPALRSNLDASELNGEGDGRVNILLIGIGGEGHDGGNLADTIIIVSIDPFAKEVAMLSIPRDMYVDIPGYWSARINAAHSIGEEEGFKEEGYPDGGPGLLQKTLEKKLDIPIHYYVRVDFSGFKEAVDAVGGVVLNVKTPLYDYEYNTLDERLHRVDTGEQYFDGERALFYARSRHTSPRGDFDRADRQRELLIALKKKVFSLGTFANPLKISNLLDAAGKDVDTNMGIGEILRLYEIAGGITEDKVVSVGLDNGPDGYLVGQNINGAAVMVPVGGDFSKIQEFVRSIFVDGFIKKEAATIEVLNGTSVEGLATNYASNLKTYGYDIVNISNMAHKNYVSTLLIDSTNDNPYTRRYLEQRLGVKAEDEFRLPEELKDSTSDFIIILGTNEQKNSKNN